MLIIVYRLSGREVKAELISFVKTSAALRPQEASEHSLESLDASWRAVGNSSHFTWNDPILGFPLSRELVAQQELHVLTYT